MFSKEKLCVGIDIGASGIKLCQLKSTKKGYVLQNFGFVPIPPEAIVDGAIMNSPRIVDAIQELIAVHKIKNKQVALSISGHSVIIKKIPLPQMTEDELQASIQWEAEQFIPFDIQDVNIDVQIVAEESAQPGQMDVVLVAAKKDVINEYTSVIAEAGLEPSICDVDAFAIQNAFENNYEMIPGETVALVNIGAAKTNINILSDGVPSFTRDLAIGGNAFTEEIQKRLNLPFEEAEAMKVGDPNQDGDAVLPQEVTEAIEAVAENVTSEIQRSIDFYAATSADPSPSKIYLLGGTSQLQPLIRIIEQRLGTEVEVVNPFAQIAVNARDAAYLESVGPAASVVVGLAMRFLGDA